MCGIVSYFGGAGNGLARILSGMSAIIYRAPDSMGIGMFGDENSPIRVLKAVGALPALVEAMTEREIRPNQSAEWLHLFAAEDSSDSRMDIQRRLLRFEGFASEQTEPSLQKGGAACPLIDALLAVEPKTAVSSTHASLTPGRPGYAHITENGFIRNRDALASLLKILIDEYDLSPVVCKILIRVGLAKEVEAAEANGKLPVPSEAVLEQFEDLFEEIYWCEILGEEEAPGHKGFQALSNQTEDALWYHLARTAVRVPRELDRDGVRLVLRDLESAMMCRLLENPRVDDAVARIFRNLWPAAPDPEKFSWKDIFQAEKAANVYGWAAGAMFEYIREKEVRPLLDSEAQMPPLSPGETDPLTLHYLTTPIIAHGRWALQSSITVENAHPFTDQRQERSVVLNGQFNGMTEATLLKYLRNSNVPLRSGNSAEYLPLLWETYHEEFVREKNRNEIIRRLMDAGLEHLFLGSQTIDYRISKQVQDKSAVDLDESAMVEAVRQIVSGDGQAATAALSVRAPRRLYVAASHRPVFIVKRKDNGDAMVVSDVQAALGLFPQSLIHRTIRRLLRLEKEKRKVLQALRSGKKPVNNGMIAELERETNRQRAAILQPLAVEILPLEEGSLLARVETEVEKNTVQRTIRVTDFDGGAPSDLESMDTVLNPLQTRRHLLKSFYEAHLEETPERMRDGLNAYLPDESGIPQFDLDERYLRRRFGSRFERLKRVVLVGMGSSYRVALMSRLFFHKVTPWLRCHVLRPVEIESVERRIDPDRDLVIFLSASGTSADMVELAHEISQHHGTLIGITEKPFSDMALITRRTGGVIPVLSGEEVTYSALKSAVCTGVICRLLAVWLACRSGREIDTAEVFDDLLGAPDRFEGVLQDVAVQEFCRNLATESTASHAAIVFDALYATGTGLEVAEKLEEASWRAVGKALDYGDLVLPSLEKDLKANLILVNATHAERLAEALAVMKTLYISGISFAAVTFDHPHLEEMRFYAQGRCIDLPKMHDANQPLVDSAFYYSLARQFGIAHGRRDPGFPRNRAKSVTVSTHRPLRRPSPHQEIQALEIYAHPPIPAAALDLDGPSPWEAQAGGKREAAHFAGMKRLARALAEAVPLDRLLINGGGISSQLLAALTDALSVGGSLVFVALDGFALATAKDITTIWRRLVKGRLEVVHPGAPIETWPEDACLVYLCTSPAVAVDRLSTSWTEGPQSLWMGVTPPRDLVPRFAPSLGILEIDAQWEETLRSEVLYAALSLLLIEALKAQRPGDAGRIEQTFTLAPQVIADVLHDGPLREEIGRIAMENPAYRTASFVGANDGIGSRWTALFDELGTCPAVSYIYGESAHGPVVTVDPSPEQKYIAIRPREELVQDFGQERVTAWETRYLPGSSIDAFLAAPETIERMEGIKPFFSDGNWFFPVLRSDYDAVEDNLIFLDTSKARALPPAMDELSLYGCRFARVVLVCQEAFQSLPILSELYQYPISQVLFLPSLRVGNALQPIPEILMPFAMSLAAMAAGAHAVHRPEDAERLQNQTRLFEDYFEPMGNALLRWHVTLNDLNHRMIESLHDIAPIVASVLGIAIYRVRRTEDEGTLDELLRTDRVYGAEQVRQNFAASEEGGYPHYLIYPEKEMFTGEAETMAREMLSDEYWDQWFDVYGDTWRCLSYERPEMNEGPGERPRIELPLLDAEKHRGRLLHLFIAYREWDGTATFDNEIEDTVRAMGKHRAADDPSVSHYTKMVSHFNNVVIHEGYLWDDAFVSLVPRTTLFAKPVNEVAQRIAGKVLGLAESVTATGSTLTTEALASALHDLWPRSIGAEWDETRKEQAFENTVVQYFKTGA